jgi:three-Cys-motif partner protein
LGGVGGGKLGRRPLEHGLTEYLPIDLWILFPLGMAVNRLLPRNGYVPEYHKATLSKIFGTDEWEREFYGTDSRSGYLWDEAPTKRKKADFQSIGRFYIDRLRGVFPGVAKNPLELRNSKNIPLYLLCFACGNPSPKAKGLALKIAQDILGQ